jgi:hypothetical protein
MNAVARPDVHAEDPIAGRERFYVTARRRLVSQTAHVMADRKHGERQSRRRWRLAVIASGLALALGATPGGALAAAHAHSLLSPLVLTGAPGRVTVGFGADSVNANGYGVVMAADQLGVLRGGGVLLGDSDRLGSNELDFVVLRTGGSLDSGFGSRGLLRVHGLGLYSVIKIIGESDGGALVLAANMNQTHGPDPLVLLRITVNGTLYSSFAGGGIDHLEGLSAPADVVATPSGSLMLASTVEPNTTHPHVVVTRLTAEGEAVSNFGSGGSVSLSPTDEQAVSITTAPDGDIVVLGNPVQLGGHLMLAALTEAGTLDPAFDGGAPVLADAVAQSSLPQSSDQQLLVQPDGTIELLYSPTTVYFGEPVESHELFITAYTAAGALDGSFGSGGTLNLSLSEGEGLPAGEEPGSEGLLLPSSEGQTLVLIPTASDRPRVIKLLADGEPGTTFGDLAGEAIDLGFGGLTTGEGSVSGGDDFGETAVQREDGSILLAGTTELAYFSGAGTGFANTFVTHDAVAALTSSLQRDTAFAARYPLLQVKARVIELRRGAVVVQVTPSQAVSVSGKVTAGGKVLANGGQILLYDENQVRRSLPLTREGRRRLARGPVKARLTVVATALDGQTRTVRTSARIP